VALEIDYRDNITVVDLERINCDIELRIQEIIPSTRVYLEAKKKSLNKTYSKTCLNMSTISRAYSTSERGIPLS
jgi:hypothetical protein